MPFARTRQYQTTVEPKRLPVGGDDKVGSKTTSSQPNGCFATFRPRFLLEIKLISPARRRCRRRAWYDAAPGIGVWRETKSPGGSDGFTAAAGEIYIDQLMGRSEARMRAAPDSLAFFFFFFFFAMGHKPRKQIIRIII